MKQSLQGKRILLIMCSGYSDGIISQMKQMGANVDYLNDKPNDGFICKALGRLQIHLYLSYIEKYYSRQIKRLQNNRYDYILIIRGEYTPIPTIIKLKQKFKNAKMILYMWDGIENYPTIIRKWRYFDKVLTFDRVDYEKYKNKIGFLPLFYYNAYLPINNIATDEKYKYDLCFIGTAHDDRIKIIKKIMGDCARNGNKCFSYFYMPHKLVYLKYKFTSKYFKNVKMSDVSFIQIPFKDLYKIYSESRCILDVENKGQHGLTMRSIEMLGLKRKLITSNKDIANYDFYNENNILIIDRKNPAIDQHFINLPYELLPNDIYEKYSLANWIIEVLK